MKAYIFPGQGSQFTGMAKDLYEQHPFVKNLFEQANEMLGFRISEVMFSGPEEKLKETEITQPAVFLHSVALVQLAGESFQPAMVAGHSLGELSALVANRTLSFEDGLMLVHQRAKAMQDACNNEPSTMAAIIGLDDAVVEKICSECDEVIPANYNCTGQLVISGSVDGVNNASEKLKAAGARMVVPLKVAGAFHSKFMEPAGKKLEEAILKSDFKKGICPIYQNIDAKPHTEPIIIQQNLILQLTAPVLWKQTIQNMIGDGASAFIEAGPGKVLQGLVKKVNKSVEAVSI